MELYEIYLNAVDEFVSFFFSLFSYWGFENVNFTLDSGFLNFAYFGFTNLYDYLCFLVNILLLIFIFSLMYKFIRWCLLWFKLR